MRLSNWAWLVISSVTADAITEHGGCLALRQRAVRFLGSAENGPNYGIRHDMNTPPKRRWLRFSLRTALIVEAVLCFVLASKIRQAEREALSVVAIEDMGGHFKTELRSPEWLWRLSTQQFRSVAIQAGVPLDAVGSAVDHLRSLPSLRIIDIYPPCTWEPMDARIVAAENVLRESLPQVEVRVLFPLSTPITPFVTIVEEEELQQYEYTGSRVE